MELRLSNGRGETIATATLTPPNDRTTVGHNLGIGTADDDGNLWIEINGRRYGSLWFHTISEIPTITLGHLTDGEWNEENPIVGAETYE